MLSSRTFVQCPTTQHCCGTATQHCQQRARLRPEPSAAPLLPQLQQATQVLASYDITRDVLRGPRLRRRTQHRHLPPPSLTAQYRRQQEAARAARAVAPAFEASLAEAGAAVERISVAEQHLVASEAPQVRRTPARSIPSVLVPAASALAGAGLVTVVRVPLATFLAGARLAAQGHRCVHTDRKKAVSHTVLATQC
jgi:hypothetical protein